MNSIRIHPVTAGLALVGVALLGAARAQQPVRLPRLTPEQSAILGHMSIVYLDDGQGGQVETIRISGVNVQVVNGEGATETLNGTGNLIVGYSEPAPFVGGFDRRGSHNLVVGPLHSFSSVGGLVAGLANSVSAPFASVTGGSNNVSSGIYSAVCGGTDNVASDAYTAVLGGIFNQATYYASTIVGGELNRSEGLAASVLGGNGNLADGIHASIGGGNGNLASGQNSVVSGGANNQAIESDSTVSGGSSRTATGDLDWVAGSLFEDQ